jgi:hypothetical protein
MTRSADGCQAPARRGEPLPAFPLWTNARIEPPNQSPVWFDPAEVVRRVAPTAGARNREGPLRLCGYGMCRTWTAWYLKRLELVELPEARRCSYASGPTPRRPRGRPAGVANAERGPIDVSEAPPDFGPYSARYDGQLLDCRCRRSDLRRLQETEHRGRVTRSERRLSQQRRLIT